MSFNKILLKANHLMFPWYYKKISDHYKKYTFKRSVDLLRQNYEHSLFELKGKDDVIGTSINEIERYRNELQSIKMQLISGNETIGFINKKFGTDFAKSNDN